MNTKQLKKQLILNIPYIILGLLATNLGEAWRIAAGANASEKVQSLVLDGVFATAFSNPLPSLYPGDLLVGIACGAALRLAVYLKGKNAKKFRHNEEYGSARWGRHADIEPFEDPVFANNVILSQSERITMSSRPKIPKYARNKNVLVVGGSGSGKTRFFIKPNLLQMHSSYVVTDPKGGLVNEVGNALYKNGYRMKIFNTINFSKSMHYNPFAYLHSEKDILKLVTTLIANTKGESKGGDDFWLKAETLLYTALIGYIHYEAPEEEQNFSTLLEMINAMEVREDDEEFKNPVDMMFDELAEQNPDHFAVRQYAKYKLACIILSVNDTYMDAQEVMHMTDYSKITALYSRLSVGDEDRDGGESNSIQNQRIFLENYARGQHLTNIRHYIDDDESGRFFDRSAYSRMMDDVENGKIGVCIMKDLTRWGRDYLQVGNAMEIFRRNNVRFIAVNNGIDSEKPDTLEFAPFINIMSEWYAKDISKKVKTGIKTKGMSGKPIVTEAPYGYIKDPDNKDFWIIDEEAAEVVRLIFRLFIGGKNRNQIAVYLTQEQIPTPTFYMKDRGRGTCKNKTLNEDNRCKWNKATLTNILTRQEYCGDVVNFKTTKHFRDKHNHYVDRSQWHITENVHEPIISRSDFETVQRILENAPVRRPNGDGEIHPLSGLLFCKDCGAKMHIRIDYRNGGKRHVAYCSEYHKGKAKNPKCHSPHIMDADLLMQTIAEVLKKIEDYSISNRAEFEALVKKNLAMQQTDQTKKQQKRIPQITTRLEQIDKVLNKLYEDNALGTIPQDRYEQMSQKYSEEYYALKAELATLQEQLSAYENAGGRAQKFLKLTERHAAFTDLTPTILNEFISRIEVHERDQKRARYAIQHISIYFNYIGKFENEVTQLAEPTEQEIRQMREEIEEAKKEKSRAYHRQYSREYRARNLEKQREYDRMKAREYRARRKAQAAAAQPTQ